MFESLWEGKNKLPEKNKLAVPLKIQIIIGVKPLIVQQNKKPKV
jgi:hypothetical protein